MSRLADFVASATSRGEKPKRKSPHHVLRKKLRGKPVADSITPVRHDDEKAE